MTGWTTYTSQVYTVTLGDYARAEVATRISDEALARLVADAAGGADGPAAVLLEAVLSVVDEVVVAQVAGTGLHANVTAAVHRRAVEDVAGWLISPTALAAWAALPAGKIRRFLEERAHEVGPSFVDHAWVGLVIEQRDKRSEALLLTRLRRVFDAATRRRLAAEEQADVAQDFMVWLIKDGHAALGRWSPTGGSSFDGWFSVRAVHHVASWRRRGRDAASAEPEKLVAAEPTPDAQVIVKQLLDKIGTWLERSCSEYQRQVFQRWFIEELSGAEIAAALGTTTEAVHMTVSRLRKAVYAAVGR